MSTYLFTYKRPYTITLGLHSVTRTAILSIMPADSKAQTTKHNWDLAYHIFLAGATHEEVSEIAGIPHIVVINYSAKHQWAKRRELSRKFAHKAISEDLTRKLEKARIRHQNFMVDQLYETQSHIEQIQIGTNLEVGEVHVMDKLAVLTCQHNLAARVLNLDNQKPEDPNELGFAMLVAMSRTTNAPLGTENNPVTYDLKGDEYAIMEGVKDQQTSVNEPIPLSPPSNDPRGPSTGILRSLNAIPESSNTPENSPTTPISQPEPQPGPQPQPYHAPQPLVNEDIVDGDQTTKPRADRGAEEQSEDNKDSNRGGSEAER